MQFTKIALAADHAGFKIKEIIKKYLIDNSYTIEDFGTHSEQSMDYPDTAHPAAESVASKKNDAGIFVCGTGQGMQLTANKRSHIRAALCWNPEIARLSRNHNDANVLTIPGRFVTAEEAIAIVQAWLDAPFEGGRHLKRIDKIEKISEC